MSKKPSPSTIAVNKKARHLYELSDFVEAGISLTGPEVKSIRAGKINFLDSYVDFRDGEAFVLSLHIAPYDNAGYVPQDPDRPRRLLLHAAEIRQTSIALDHVPIIDRNPRRGERNVDNIGGRRVSIVDAMTRRYYVRSGIERVFSHLHEAHGGKFVRVRGSAKVLLHLMFGLIVIASEQIYANGMLT